MRGFGVVLAKECRDNLRDRRTILASFSLALLGPALFTALMSFVLTSTLGESRAGFRLAVVGAEHAPRLVDHLRRYNVEVAPVSLDDPRQAVRDGVEDLVLVIDADYPRQLETGGVGRPDGMNRGYFVKPTVFSNVTNDMTIAQEEIFGPVLSLIGYKDEEDAVRIANDTVYGLSAYVSSGDVAHAAKVGREIRAGNVHLNGAGVDPGAPFGGYKQSGNGREFSKWGLEEFLETKALLGYNAA